MRSPLEWSLLHGWLPVTICLAAAGGATLLLQAVVHGRVRRGLAAAGIAVALAAGGGWLVDHVWRPFPDPLPVTVLARVAFGLTGIGLAVVAWPRTGRRRVVAVLAAAATVLGAATAVNAFYGQFSTVRAALGVRPENMIGIDDMAPHGVTATGAAADQPLAAVWHRPPELATSGRLLNAAIPGERSGFAARPAWVYLPPAYLAAERAVLPVLILLSGQPGSPRDWIDGGRVDRVMDDFARAHDGLAPLVVMPDALGSLVANPLCLDSRLGNVETYLSEDVPAWVRAHFDVDPSYRHWAVGGYSYGGTCSLQLGVRRPDRYPTLLDISGQREPTLGDRAGTVAAAFGGDAAAFVRVNPLDILAGQRFAGSEALLVSGLDDAEYGPQQRLVRAACERAGMTVRWWELPGGHSWQVWGAGLVAGLPRLAVRMGITAA
ncbi:alpha/beta hydrolase [Dactylosporangium sp. McL0621]|uniref:alpha/beta hydrolase n=1 Tax=Dactylosporangium sp. McL0621 TaxID=3415678 RepID=UPI003CE7A472